MVVSVGLAGWVVAMMSLAYETVKTFYVENRNTRIAVLGAPSVGKTTFLYQLKYQVPVAPLQNKTERTSLLSQRIKVNYDDKSRHMKTKDVPGEGYLTGEWWRLLLELKPLGIIFLVDNRIVENDEQVNIFKTLISLLTSASYMKMVKKKDRVKVMLIAVNKADLWQGDGMDVESMLDGIKDELVKLPDYGIAWNWASISAKYSEHIDYVINWMVKSIESDMVI